MNDIGYGVGRAEHSADKALAAHNPSTARSSNAAARQDPDEIQAGALDGLTVLLVEDDPVSREALELILQYYGAHVLSATSVLEALDSFEHSSPTVVVSDIGLPKEDGYSLLRSIRTLERQRGYRTPAIAISGFPSGETAERARRAGFDAFLRKPINIRALLHLVCSLA